MPAVSPEQQRLMAQAYALKTGKKKKKDLNPEYAEQISKLAKSMTAKQLRDFAKTKHSSMKEGILNFDSFNEGHKEINHKNQKLSKDLKKQDHVSSKKPNNSTLSSEDHLAETPKKGTYREPNSKKIDGEKFLAKDHKLTHIKEFNNFLNEGLEDYIIDGERTDGEWSKPKVKQENVLKWWNSLDITLQTHLANEYSANFDIIETIPYDEILNIYRNEMNLTESSIPGDTGKTILNIPSWHPYYKELTKEEKNWLEAMIEYADDRIGFEPNDIQIKKSIFSKLGIN